MISQTINYWENFQVNKTEANWSGAFPKVIELNNGNMVVCWRKGNDNIVGRIYNSQLIPQSNEILLINHAGNSLSKTNTRTHDKIIGLLALDNNNFVVFTETHSVLSGVLFNQNGVRVSNTIKISAPSNYAPQKPKLSLLNNNSFVVTWHLGPSVGATRTGNSKGVYCQVFSNLGIAISKVKKVNTTDKKNEWNPTVASTVNGGFIISWQSGLWDIREGNVFGQFFDSDGIKIGKEILINSDTLGYQRDPNISIFNNTQKIITWTSRDKVVARIIDDNGVFIGNEFLVKDNEVDYTKIVNLENCGIALTSDNDSKNIFVKVYDKNLNVNVDWNFIDTTNWFSNYSSSTSFGKNGFIVCWQGEGKNINCRYFLNKPIVHQLSNFKLIWPAHDATINTNNATLVWKSSTNEKICYSEEIFYKIILSTDVNFVNIYTIISVNNDTSYSFFNLPSQTYFWKVLAKNINGDSLWSSNVNGFYTDENATDIEIKESSIPKTFELKQNYPNPFNPTTIIKYSIPVVDKNTSAPINIIIKIFNTLGKDVTTLVNKNQPPGNYEVNFIAKDLPSGIYFYRLTVGNFTETKKMILLR